MQTRNLIIILFFPLTCCAQPIEGNIQTRQLGVDTFELSITTAQTTDIRTAQEALIPTAKNVCGNKEPQFDSYDFHTNEIIKSANKEQTSVLTLTQKIKCGTETQKPKAESTTNQWPPTKKEQSEIERLTYEYFQEIDQGHYQQAYSTLSHSMQAENTLDSWQSEAKQSNDKAGKLLKRQITKVTWYNNPYNAKNPGIYAAVDYISQFENIEIQCGYVTWHQEKSEFQISALVEYSIDKTSKANMNQDEFAKLKVKFGCNTS